MNPTFNPWMTKSNRNKVHGCSKKRHTGVLVCNLVAVQPNQVYLFRMQIPMEIQRFIIFFTPRFTVPEYKEIISISPLDELLLMGNYLSTIDGTSVNNSAASVHNMRERQEEKEGKKENL